MQVKRLSFLWTIRNFLLSVISRGKRIELASRKFVGWLALLLNRTSSLIIHSIRLAGKYITRSMRRRGRSTFLICRSSNKRPRKRLRKSRKKKEVTRQKKVRLTLRGLRSSRSHRREVKNEFINQL